MPDNHSPSAYDAELARFQQALAATPDMARQRAAILGRLGDVSGQRVLEIGCGSGALVNDLEKSVGTGGRVVGLDASEAILSLAQPHRSDTRFINASAAALPFADGSFDAIAAAQIYCFIPDLAGALSEARRVLRPGGRLVILDTDWHSLDWTVSDLDLARKILLSHYADADIPARLPSLLKAAGFDAIDQTRLLLADETGDADAYGSHLNQSVVQALKTVSRYSQTQLHAWERARREAIAAERYRFRLERVLTAAVAA